MENHKEDNIRARAHEIWENAGKPDGEHEGHWSQAAQELGLESPNEQERGTTVEADASRRSAERGKKSKSLPIAQ